MNRAFWNGLEKRANEVATLREAATKALSHGKTFSKGVLIGAGGVGAAVGLHHMAQTPSVRPLQQGY